MTHRAIVLAAGKGSRLVSDEDFPKPLKPIASVPLLVRILRTLQGEGIREAVVVVGYRGEQIRERLEREPSLALKLHFVVNEQYEKKNGVSLLAARDFVDGAFADGECLLTMADHLYSPEVVRRLRAFDLPAGSCALAVDRDVERCFDLDDATKVQLGQGHITRIGKDLEDYDVIDTGVFRIGPALVAELEQVYRQNGDCSLSDGVGRLAAAGRMLACSIGDARWIDVDTPEAARRAEAMLHVFGEDLGDEPEAGRSDPEAIELFAPSWVRAAKPYNEDHFALAERRDVVRMMSNESPYQPSERVVEAVVKAALSGNLYPSRAAELRRKLAAKNGLDESQVLLGAGSAELIDLAIRTFVAPGEEVVLSVPTFSMYEARTRTVGGIPILVPMADDPSEPGGAFDLPGIIGAITERTKLIFLCTPNNPTGNRLDEDQLRRVLRLGLPTVIDEAYVELCEDERARAGMHHLLAEYPNALVLRTFSKAFGLAGMRVGYALGHAAHVRLLSRVKVPWNLSSVAIAAACAALDDVAEHERRLASLRGGRRYLERELGSLPGVEVIPSEGNFVLLDADRSGLLADEIVEAMLAKGIFIRSLRSHHADRGFVRVTVGDDDQNRRCVAAMRQLLQPATLPAAARRALA